MNSPICWRGAFGPKPVIAGLEEVRKAKGKSETYRHAGLSSTELSLTEFGKAVMAHQEDFSRHNPIDRWWGGTHLTNDKLWRFDPGLQIK